MGGSTSIRGYQGSFRASLKGFGVDEGWFGADPETPVAVSRGFFLWVSFE